jgi:hypothetical protein
LAKLSIARHQIMIRNGIYLAETRFLDGVDAYNRHVMVLRDGTMRGGGGFYYTVGSYTCSDGKWKGPFLVRIHGHEKISALDLPVPIGMTVPNSKPRHWLASNPFDSNLSTGCYLRIELQPWMPPAKLARSRLGRG